MDHDVFGDKGIGDTLKKDVVYLRIDVDKSPGAARTCGVWAYPTTLLLESTGKRITQIPGYVSKGETLQNNGPWRFSRGRRPPMISPRTVSENRPKANEASLPIGSVNTIYGDPP
jgi:hypothetical protein